MLTYSSNFCPLPTPIYYLVQLIEHPFYESQISISPIEGVAKKKAILAEVNKTFIDISIRQKFELVHGNLPTGLRKPKEALIPRYSCEDVDSLCKYTSSGDIQST